MSDMERKFGRYAVRDLSLKLIILYLAGYAIYYLNANIMYYMTLNPYAIVHGQVWRIVSWILIPPQTSNIFFVAIMLFFYYSIGTSLERIWGVWRYNVFIFTGILLTIAAAFAWMGYAYLLSGDAIAQIGAADYFGYYSLSFSTYYINMGIFFAYALTFPDAVVLLFFILPVKVKWLGLLDVAYLVYEFFTAPMSGKFAILATFLNIAILYRRFKGPINSGIGKEMLAGLFSRSEGSGGGAAGKMRGRSRAGSDILRGGSSRGVVHRCAICRRTQDDNPDLEFRYCSKCEGSVEYCQDHLFTHVHIKAGEKPHING